MKMTNSPTTRTAWIKHQIEEVLRTQGCPKGMITLREASRVVGVPIEALLEATKAVWIPSWSFGGVVLLDRRAFFAKHAGLANPEVVPRNKQGLNVLVASDAKPCAAIGNFWAAHLGLIGSDHTSRPFGDDMLTDDTLPVWLSKQIEVQTDNVELPAVWEVTNRWRDFKEFREKVAGIIEIAPSCVMLRQGN